MDTRDNSLRPLVERNLVLYLIGINNQKDALACRNGSRYFITKVNMTLKRREDYKHIRVMVVQHVINRHKTRRHISFCLWSDVTVINDLTQLEVRKTSSWLHCLEMESRRFENSGTTGRSSVLS